MKPLQQKYYFWYSVKKKMQKIKMPIRIIGLYEVKGLLRKLLISMRIKRQYKSNNVPKDLRTLFTKHKAQITITQKKCVLIALKYLKSKNFKFDVSVENEVVFVKKTEIGQTLLVIDTEGDGMFSFASYESREKHKRTLFGRYNFLKKAWLTKTINEFFNE
jgi:hypothetical protein